MVDDTIREAEIGSFFVSQYRRQWLTLALVSLLSLAAIDYLTRFTLHLTMLYPVPVLILTWFIGRLFGVILSVTLCTSWSLVELAAGRYDDVPKLLYWDWAAMLLGLLLMVIGLSVLRRALENAYSQSRRDTLTGLVNKGGFYQVVNEELELCRRYKRTLSIAYIDCDNFKMVNDRFGHHAGDDLLRVIARTMLRKLRMSDLPGRLGGDEFAVMLPETSAEACHMVLEMLQQRLLREMNDHGWPVTFSVGIATFVRMPPSIEDMVRQADKLMYEVKRSRKGAIKQETFGA